MTRNSKQVRQRELAEYFTVLHLKGQKGPSRTRPVHGKSAEHRWCKHRREWYARKEHSKRPNRFRGM